MFRRTNFTAVAGGAILLVAIVWAWIDLKPAPREQFLKWSIGIYTGNSPLSLSQPANITNPVLKVTDITGMKASFLADPFMTRSDSSQWVLFMEIADSATRRGCIGLATSEDGFKWKYDGVVLDEPFHLSYPYVFKSEDKYYMVPESRQAKSVRLYEAVEFPHKWRLASVLLEGEYVDSSLLQYSGKWWMFTKTPDFSLHLFHADKLTGPWIEHPKSPVVISDKTTARPGGRVIVYGGKVYRYAQDGYPNYGRRVWAMEITKLTTTEYHEQFAGDSPVVKASGHGWNRIGMHTVDPHEIKPGEWISCVDGCAGYGEW
jgi:hypothetical protein